MKKSEIKIIVDDTIDFFPSFNEKSVEVVRNHMFLNDSEVKMDKSEFYEKVADDNNSFRTSQANPEEFKQVFDKYKENILAITVSSKLSGVNNSANIAKKESKNKNIIVIDSKNISVGLCILADEANKMIQNRSSLNEIENRLKSLTDKLRFCFILPELKYLVKGGRVNKVVGVLGGLVHMKPILEIKDGSIVSAGKMVLSKDIASAFYDFVKTKIKNTDKVYIAHNSLDAETKILREKLASDYDTETIKYLNPLLGVHAGPLCLAVGWLER